MNRTFASCSLVVFTSAGPFSSCNDLEEFLLGTKPIEEKPAAVELPSAPASQTNTSPGEPDPRLAIKLPSGGEASFEYAEARRLMNRGQLMAASFVIMPKALSDTGTTDELDLLAELCTKREDSECVATVKAHKNGLRGAGKASLEDLRKLAKKSPEDLRNLLMPRLENGTITAEQVELLGEVCHKLREKQCESMVENFGR